MKQPKTKISHKLLRQVATLARLKLTPSEEKTFLSQLSTVLDYFSVLSKVDTLDIKPSFQIIELTKPFRSDKIKKCLPKQNILSSAPRRSDDYFQVKSTIKK